MIERPALPSTNEELAAALISWPQPLAPYNHSGEGGLFCIAVWPCVDDANPRFRQCHLGVWPTVNMGNVLVTPKEDRGDLFADPDDSPCLPEDATDLARLSWEMEVREHWESAPLLAAVHLGSTRTSLFHDETGSYYSATRADLTVHGAALLTVLDRLYGTPAILLTYLDT